MLVQIYKKDRLIVIVIIIVFVMVNNRLKPLNSFKKIFKIIAAWNIDLGNIPATKPEIIKNIVTKTSQFFTGFVSIQNGYAIAVLAYNMGYFAKIKFKLAGTIIASGCDHSVKIGQAFNIFKLIFEIRLNFN